MTETELASRVAKSGDAVAFAELVGLTQGRVRAFLMRLTRGERALADDLAQETYLEAHRKLAQYRGEGAFAGWLIRIAWSRFQMHLRARGQAPEELDDTLPAPLHDPSHKLDLERAMARLSAPERAALTLCYAMEYSHAEAAALLALPLGTVKSHVTRGREKLRALLGDGKVAS